MNTKAPMIPYMNPGCIPDRRLMNTHTAASTSVHRATRMRPRSAYLPATYRWPGRMSAAVTAASPSDRDAEHQ